MPDALKKFVLDTSALLCFKEDEPGADVVEKILRDAKGHVYISFISLMEFYYILIQEQGESSARRSYLELKQLPLHVIESDEELGLAAGRLKAANKLSLGDAWVAATAERLEAILVHKDPEFEALEDTITLQPLPYK
jgi:predicted nucleic acid-binding protein